MCTLSTVLLLQEELKRQQEARHLRLDSYWSQEAVQEAEDWPEQQADPHFARPNLDCSPALRQTSKAPLNTQHTALHPLVQYSSMLYVCVLK